jgi:hypothetical protein
MKHSLKPARNPTSVDVQIIELFNRVRNFVPNGAPFGLYIMALEANKQNQRNAVSWDPEKWKPVFPSGQTRSVCPEIMLEQ